MNKTIIKTKHFTFDIMTRWRFFSLGIDIGSNSFRSKNKIPENLFVELNLGFVIIGLECTK